MGNGAAAVRPHDDQVGALFLRNVEDLFLGITVAGFHNLYYAALLAQFLGLACLAQWLVRRKSRAALGAFALLVVLVQPSTNVGALLFDLRRHRAAIAGLL